MSGGEARIESDLIAKLTELKYCPSSEHLYPSGEGRMMLAGA